MTAPKWEPLTPAERIELGEDDSKPAVDRYAEHLLSLWAYPDALNAADKHAGVLAPQDPRRDFWRRVRAKVQEIHDAQACAFYQGADGLWREYPRHAITAEMKRCGSGVTCPGHTRTAPAPQWHDEDSRRPNAKPRDPKQGGLFE
jgi:hypothetical protein